MYSSVVLPSSVIELIAALGVGLVIWVGGQQVFAGEATRLAYMTDEAEEGRDAFLEKRDRNFTKFPWHF